MNTSIQTNPMNVSVNAENVQSKTDSAANVWQRVEFHRFGIVPMILVIITCIGGLAAAVAIQESALKLAIVTLPVAVTEAMVLAVMPMRAIVIASALSVVLSLLVVIL